MGSKQFAEFDLGGYDEHAAFVQQRKRVLRGCAVASDTRPLLLERTKMAFIQRSLGARKGQPRERVEYVVPLAGTNLDFASQEYTRFILVFEILRVRRLSDATHRTSGRIRRRHCPLCEK